MNASTRDTVSAHGHDAENRPASNESPEDETQLPSAHQPAAGAPHVAAHQLAFDAPDVPVAADARDSPDAADATDRPDAPLDADASRFEREARSSRRTRDVVFPGRYTGENDAEIVVFLIGLRFNGLRGLLPALQAFIKMPTMLAALARKPELGCLGGHVAFGWRVAYVIQYWRSYDDLERFAHAPDEDHFPAWRWYARLGANARGTGIWHETFRVAAGAYESIYFNMPQFGLAKATAHRSVGNGSSSRERISTRSATG